MTDNVNTLKAVKLGILISGGGTTLQNLAECIACGKIDAQITCVIASNDKAYGIERAKKLGLPVYVVSRKEFGPAFSDRIADLLREHQVDLVCMAGFLALWQIPADFAGRVLNIHPALLPKFGGKGMHGQHVHEAVLAAGEKESGCTVHFADNQYDHGPVILQGKCPVLATDTADTLAARVFAVECDAYPVAIRWVNLGILIRSDREVRMRKAFSYITRQQTGHTQLLVFDNADVPEDGTQVPAGTVDRGENPDHAVLREAFEETGIKGLRVIKKIGVFDWLNPRWNNIHERHVYHLTTDEQLPDAWEWTETAGGTLKPEEYERFMLRWINLSELKELSEGHHLYLSGIGNS